MSKNLKAAVWTLGHPIHLGFFYSLFLGFVLVVVVVGECVGGCGCVWVHLHDRLSYVHLLSHRMNPRCDGPPKNTEPMNSNPTTHTIVSVFFTG